MAYYRCSVVGGTGQYYAVKVGSGAGTYNISSIYDDYRSLTQNNFIVECKAQGGMSVGSSHGGWSTTSGHATRSEVTVQVNYNASNGVLSVSGRRATASDSSIGVGGYAEAVPGNIYLVTGL